MLPFNTAGGPTPVTITLLLLHYIITRIIKKASFGICLVFCPNPDSRSECDDGSPGLFVFTNSLMETNKGSPSAGQTNLVWDGHNVPHDLANGSRYRSLQI